MTSLPKRWPVQEAKAKFSELLERSLSEGPQIVTKRGVEAAVLVPIEQWQSLSEHAAPSFKALLLSDRDRAELALPKRGNLRRRPPTSR